MARTSYDRLSRWYDLLAGGAERRLRELGFARLAPAAGEVVLEIGSGTGQVLTEIGRSVGRAGSAIGLDLSSGMCHVARRRITAAALAANTFVLCGDARSLPLRAGSCNAAFMSFALELFAPGDMARVLSECRRVLVPGGRLCVVAMAEPASPRLMSRLYARAHQLFPAVVDCRPICVPEVLTANGFAIHDAATATTWGLPVAVVLAQSSTAN